MGPGRAAVPGATFAFDGHLQVEGLARAEHDIDEGEVEHGLRVGAPCRAAGTSTPRTRAAEERVEQVVETERAGIELAAPAEPTGVRTFRAEHVVATTPLGIAERVVRLVDLLEPLDRGRVVGIRVGG